MNTETRRPSPSPQRILWLGASLPLGWGLLDFWLLVHGREPMRLLDFLPITLAAMVSGALVAWIARSWLLHAGLVLVSLCASLVAASFAAELSRADRWLPVAIFLMLICLGLGRVLFRRYQLSGLRTGTCLGILAAASISLKLETSLDILLPIVLLSVGALCIGGLGSAAWRKGLTVVLFAVGLGFLGWELSLHPRPIRRAPLLEAQAPESANNLLLIVLDTVTAKHLKPYGYERETTPALDRFAHEHATIYGSARSTSPFTLASHGSIFTGLFPTEHGATRPAKDARPLRPDVETLPERLNRAGFQTAAVISNGVYINPLFGFDRGFEYFDSRTTGLIRNHMALPQLLGKHLRIGHLKYRPATAITDDALDWLEHERDGRPFFLMLNYMDAHMPYHPPAPFNQAFSDEQPLDPIKPTQEFHALVYDRELLYLDSQLERLFESLRTQGLFDSTAIVVTSDHGEALGGHGLIDHCWMLYDDVVHVPLYVKPAGGRTSERNDDPISGAEVFGLSLGLAGLEQEPAEPVNGMIGEWHPWRGFERKTLLWAKRLDFDPKRSLIAWHEDQLKFIVSSDGSVEAYDLELDPDELHPVELTPERVDAALQWAATWWAEHPAPPNEDLELNQDHVDMLKALGYGG